MHNQAFATRLGFGPFARGHCGGQGRPAGGPDGRRRGIPPWARFPDGGWVHTPVNIETTDNSFILKLYAAGLAKENIQLSVQNDVLTIAYQGRAPGPDAAAAEARYTRREFRDPSFERTFQLNGKVLVDNISAGYAEGVLTVTLPKNPAANPAAQPIAVQ